jgi:16S rRNA (guanine1207-N2)-methyltransferase
MARRERGDPPDGPIFAGDFGSFSFEAGTREVTVARHPAVFSDGVLDDASRMLIECLPEASGRQLDLGCGSGAVAAAMSVSSPDSVVTAVDVSAPAVETCRETVRLNGLANVGVFPSYFGEDLADRNFDIIASYPPFHVGPHMSHEPAQRLIREAARLLDAGGTFFVVQSSAQSHEALLESCFAVVRPVASSRSHRVHACSEPVSPESSPG